MLVKESSSSLMSEVKESSLVFFIWRRLLWLVDEGCGFCADYMGSELKKKFTFSFRFELAFLFNEFIFIFLILYKNIKD